MVEKRIQNINKQQQSDNFQNIKSFYKSTFRHGATFSKCESLLSEERGLKIVIAAIIYMHICCGPHTVVSTLRKLHNS